MSKDNVLFPTEYANARDSSRKPVENPEPTPEEPKMHVRPQQKRPMTTAKNNDLRAKDKRPTILQPLSKKSNSRKNNFDHIRMAPHTAHGRRRLAPAPVKLDALAEEVISNPVQLPQREDEIQRVLKQLDPLQKQHIRNGEYPEAQKIQRIIMSLKKKLVHEQENSLDVNDVAGKHQEVQAIISKLLNDWNSQYDEFLQTTDDEIKALQKSQEEELAIFDASMPVELTPHYRKKSIALIEARDKERALALNRKFRAAQRVKEKTDEAEQVEANIQFNKMQEDFMKKREKIINRQDEQMNVLVEHAEATRLRMLKQRDASIEGYIKRINYLDDQLDTMCKNGKTNEDEINKYMESNDRAKLIAEIETAYPIPLMRPGTAFTVARRKIQSRRNQMAQYDKHAPRPKVPDSNEQALDNENQSEDDYTDEKVNYQENIEAEENVNENAHREQYLTREQVNEEELIEEENIIEEEPKEEKINDDESIENHTNNENAKESFSCEEESKERHVNEEEPIGEHNNELDANEEASEAQVHEEEVNEKQNNEENDTCNVSQNLPDPEIRIGDEEPIAFD